MDEGENTAWFRLFWKIPLSITTSVLRALEEPFFIDIVVDKFISKNNQVGTSMEDSTSYQTSVLVRRAFKMLFFVANASFIIRLIGMTTTEHFPWPPEYVLHKFSNTKNKQMVKPEKGDFARSRN